MKKVMGATIAAGAAMLGSAAMVAPAHAEVSFNVGLATDYIFRGIDQTGEWNEGQAFAGVDSTVAEQFYVGAWVSNTGGNPDGWVEYDLYAGWKPMLGPVALDLGAIYYGYTDNDETGLDESDSSNFELKAAGSVPVGGATLGAQLYWTPDFAGDNDGLDNDGFYYEANAAYTFSNKATLSGAVGAVDVEDYVNDSYTTWNAGVTYPILDNLSIDARYIGVDDDAVDYFSAGDGNRLVATLKVTM